MVKVSILIPVYGVEKHIERCARSLFEQTYENIEYIFVDDCSPDDSIGVLNRVICDYPSRINYIRIIRNENNKGLAASRKVATLNATGEYIIHVDSDDYITKDAIECLVKEAQKNNADMVVSHMLYVFNDGNTRTLECKYSPNKNDYIKKLLKRKANVCLAGKLIKKKIIIDNNLFAKEGINQGEDYYVVPTIAYHCHSISSVNRALYFYIRYNDNAYTANYNAKSIDNLIEVMNHLSDFFSNIPDKQLFQESVNLAKLYNKLTLLSSSDLCYYRRIGKLYSDVIYISSSIDFKFKLLLLFIDLHLYKLSYYLIQFFKKRIK